MPNENSHRFSIRSLVFWGVVFVGAFGLFSFVRDFTACWRLTSLPGLPLASCAGQPVEALEEPVIVIAGETAVPTATTEAPVVEEITYPTWDGASRINILFVGLRGGDPQEGDCPFCTDTLIQIGRAHV